MERSRLARNQQIKLFQTAGDDGTFSSRTFVIEDFLSEGGSVLCYRAVSNGVSGLLKEFYPSQPALCLSRNGPYLFPDAELPAQCARFFALQKLYQDACVRVAALCRGNPDIATFMPSFELYRGQDEAYQPCGTLYVWFPQHPSHTFAEICSGLLAEGLAEPQKDLETVLRCIRELARCVRILHCNGFVVCDIKPENFGFHFRNTILVEQLTLFDFNSIYDLTNVSDDSAIPPRFATRGFTEPQISAVPSIKTDVYSIGATLFYALRLSQKELYQDDFYDALEYMVKSSPFLSKIAPHGRVWKSLAEQLTAILKGCLAYDRNQRDCCEMLIRRLDAAIAQCGQLSVRTMHQKAAIQYNLYLFPFARTLPAGEARLRLLLVGFDGYAQQFLDQSLALAQNMDRALDVTVLCHAGQCGKYLRSRPALPAFFNIDGGLDGSDSYGSIHFVKISAARHPGVLRSSYENAVRRALAAGQPPIRNVFVSFEGSDAALNSAMAHICRSLILSAGQQPAVRYIVDTPPQTEEPGLIPVSVRVNTAVTLVEKDLLRMAHNAHCVWHGPLAIQERKTDAVRFDRSYYKNASVSNVVAIQWKLLSLGIDLDHMKPEQAVALFQEKIRDPSVLNHLIWREHRRWVTEKLCAGWRPLAPEDCPPGQDKDKKSKQHGCLVKSRPDQNLKALTSRYGRTAVWDESLCLDELDDLDRFSVRLHQTNGELARQFSCSEEAFFQHFLQQELSQDTKSWALYQEWQTCLDELRSHPDGSKLRQESLLYHRLADAVEQMGGASCALLAQYSDHLSSLRLFSRYTSYKDFDCALVQDIPFILLDDPP